MRIITGLIVLGLLFSAAAASPKKSKKPSPILSEGNGPQFRCQLGQRLGETGDTLQLVVAASVPYDNLVFLRTDSGFTSSFELTTSLFREGEGLVEERMHTMTVFVKSYSETNSLTKNALRVEVFRAVPGDYKARVTMIGDRETGQKSSWEGKITLAVTDPLLRLSDIFWVSKDSVLAGFGVPRVTESFSSEDLEEKAGVQFSSSGSQPINFRWTILGEKQDTIRATVVEGIPTATIQNSEYTLQVKGLAAQRYTLRLEAEGNGRREVRTLSFSLRIPGIPLSIKDIDVAIRQLKYVATASESEKLRSAPPAEKERLFKEFWKKRDPTPGTEDNELMDEYYRRVEYANEMFTTHREGWETDRGRIYVLYGEPTDIERHPFDSDSRPYEIWYYGNIARRFIFMDYTGFGDYTLTTPEWGY